MVFLTKSVKQKLKDIKGRKKADRIRVRITKEYLESLPTSFHKRTSKRLHIIGMLRRAGIPTVGFLMYRGVETGRLDISEDPSTLDMIVEWEGELEIPAITDDQLVCPKCLTHQRYISRCNCGKEFVKYGRGSLGPIKRYKARKRFARMYREEFCKEHVNP